MNLKVRNWLPKSAFGEAAVKAGLGDAIAAWSSRWFAGAQAAVASVHHGGGPVTIDMPPRSKRYLLEAALGIELAGQVLCEADRQLLDALAQKIAEDLLAELDRVLGTDDGDGERLGVRLAIGENEILSLALPEHLLVPVLKRRLGGAMARNKIAASRAEALKKTKLNMHGHIGRADLAISELRQLGAGDVLVLDRMVGEPVELRLAGSVIARGKLCRGSAGQVSIQL